jgi:hypothetical protein
MPAWLRVDQGNVLPLYPVFPELVKTVPYPYPQFTAAGLKELAREVNSGKARMLECGNSRFIWNGS